MAINLIKQLPVSLRSVGVDEKWLQNQIEIDPSLLGLGELEVVGREHRQPAGGRIDFLMRKAEDETYYYYEIELMLGALDESHIIRTIEYWDVERQRRPTYQHYAVIVAEQITSRFFNVVRLLNRAVPLIAIKLSAFKFGENDIILHPVTVLNVLEMVPEDDTENSIVKSRAYWEKKSHQTLMILDKIVSLIKTTEIEVRVTYNLNHIAIGSTGYNFCWIHPRSAVERCLIKFRVDSENRDSILSQLQTAGLDPSSSQSDYIKLRIALADLEKNSDVLANTLKIAELSSK